MKNIPRILLALVVFFSGAALVPFIGLPEVGFHWQQYADAYEPVALKINHTSGQPGSFFTVQGVNFPPEQNVTILVNGAVLGEVMTDSSGQALFLIDTTGAETGYYMVEAQLPERPTTNFRLFPDDPLHPQEDDGPIFVLPGDIAIHLNTLPIVNR